MPERYASTVMDPVDANPNPESENIYEVPIEDAFDLHPYRPSDVLRMLDAYLDAAVEKGLFEVRLIHGKVRFTESFFHYGSRINLMIGSFEA